MTGRRHVKVSSLPHMTESTVMSWLDGQTMRSVECWQMVIGDTVTGKESPSLSILMSLDAEQVTLQSV